MDITTIPTVELRELLKQIPAELKKREHSEKARIRQQLEAEARKLGYSLDELMAAAPKRTGTVRVKYVHPENSDLTWTGRGRMPRWVSALKAEGKEPVTLN